MTQTIAKIPKNGRGEEIHVTLDEFNGHQLFNVRVFYKAQDGTMRPGKAGIAFKVDLLEQFGKAVIDAIIAARAQGLIK